VKNTCNMKQSRARDDEFHFEVITVCKITCKSSLAVIRPIPHSPNPVQPQLPSSTTRNCSRNPSTNFTYSRPRIMHAIEMLCLLALIFVVRIFFLAGTAYNRAYRTPTLTNLSGVVTIIALTIAYSQNSIKASASQFKCVDLDIGGAGGRIGLFLTVVFLTFQGGYGLLSRSNVANRDVASGLLFLNMTFASLLIFQKMLGKLSLGDAVIGSILVDAQSTALASTLSWRGTLNTRWFFGAVCIASGLSLASMAVAIAWVCLYRFSTRSDPWDDGNLKLMLRGLLESGRVT
jgi:hypothetical protein